MHKTIRLHSCLVLFAVLGGFHRTLLAQGRPFTVADSIGMQRFTDPYLDRSRNVTSLSPDRKSFFVVTTRGLVDENLLESTIWLFDVKAEQALLAGGMHSLAPKPEALVSRAGINDSQQQELQASILLPKWSADGQSLLFLGRNKNTTWHLYRIGLKDKRLEQLSPGEQNVVQYQEEGHLIAYAVSMPWPVTPLPRMIVGTGQRLGNLLFPDTHPSYPNQNELWTYSHRQARPVIDPLSHEIVRLNTHIGDTILALDPDGHYAVIASAVASIPESWTTYQPGYVIAGITLQSPERLKQAFNFDIPERLMLVDLKTGRSSDLLDAPLGRDVSWDGATKILWSSDGKQILLCNEFLPIAGVSEQEREDREQQPAIVLFEIANHTWTRIAGCKQSGPSDSKKWKTKDFSWGRSADEVVITYTEQGPPAETFRRFDRGWILTQEAQERKGATELETLPLIVSVKESLTMPPRLFASASLSIEASPIWDPNPQFGEIAFGTAEIYNWKDRYGRDVKGVLIKPPHIDPKQRYPLVIEPRAYSQNVFVVDGAYPTAVADQAMAADGLMILQAGEPAVPQNDVFRQETPAALAGYEAAITKLTTEGLIDPKRVGIIGFSRTCDNVMYAITANPRLFAVATIANGFTYGLMGYFEMVDESNYNGAMKQWALHYGGNPLGEGETAYLQENAIFNLRKVTAPLRVETHDRTVMLSDWESYAGLRSLGKPVDLIVLPYATHVVTMPADLIESQQGDVDWFRFWLQGYERPHPEDPDQYTRWEHLRELQDAAKKTTVQMQNKTAKPN